MLSEVTLTLLAVYGTFFVAEASDWNSCGEPLVSGVLATVALGVVLAKEGKANMSVEAQVCGGAALPKRSDRNRADSKLITSYAQLHHLAALRNTFTRSGRS